MRRVAKLKIGKLPGWLPALFIVVAGASYWAGLHNLASRAPQTSYPPQVQVSAKLPEISSPVLEPGADTNVSALPAPDPPAAEPAVDPLVKRTTGAMPDRGTRTSVASGHAKAKTAIVSDPYPLWPSSRTDGADGRLVRIGNFDSTADALAGWQKVLGEYPGMARLQPIVTSTQSLRDGRTFFSLQLGTSSQAHSQVACDRARQLDMRCTLVGLIVNEAQ